MHMLKRLYVHLRPHHPLVLETVVQLLFVFVLFTGQAYAVIRFTQRSLFIYNPTPSVTTTYTVSLTYTSTVSVGSLDMLFCNDPIPTDPCDPPAGLNVSQATLSDQTGITGYSVATHTANHLMLTRTPGVVGNTHSTYTFTNVVNPSDTTRSFSIRLSDYASTDATGPVIDLGSVLSAPDLPLTIETQVQPILMFCAAQEVSQDCSDVSDINFTDLGSLSSTHTLTATSQIAAGTNASAGYVITANGPPMEAGTNVIDALTSPTASAAGNAQFGINLRANSAPTVGSDPDGAFTNANPTSGYNIPNKFMYKDGDVVASAPNVSLVRRFTISYIVNVPANLRAGVYTTTLTYICTGRF